MINIRTAMRLLVQEPRTFLETIFTDLNRQGLLHWLSDKQFVCITYWLKFGKKLNLKNPQTCNEKLQWLKLNDHRPEYVRMVDKIAMKDYIAERLGAQYAIPTLGTWEKIDDIAWEKLPEKFVLKWNHDSGSIVICKDRKSFSKDAAIKKLNHGEKVNGFWYGREWPYKGVKPMLLAEPYLEDKKTGELRDYKVFCFNGEAKLLLIASDRQKKGESVKFDYFDINGKHLDIVNDHPQANTPPELPSAFKLMFELAEKLSEGYPHLRVDFYEVNGTVYIGELTLYHGSGLMWFKPDVWPIKMGKWLDLHSVTSKA